MNIEELEIGVNIETNKVEFKRILKEGVNEKTGERYEFNRLKEIAAFANCSGGIIYIGVDDETHEIKPFNHTLADKIILMIHRNIKNHLEPPIKYEISEIPIKEKDSFTSYVLKLEIFEAKYKPISLRFHGIGFIFVRHFGETSIASGEEIRELVLNSENISFDEEVTSEDFNEKEFSKLFDYYEKVN